MVGRGPALLAVYKVSLRPISRGGGHVDQLGEGAVEVSPGLPEPR